MITTNVEAKRAFLKAKKMLREEFKASQITYLTNFRNTLRKEYVISIYTKEAIDFETAVDDEKQRAVSFGYFESVEQFERAYEALETLESCTMMNYSL